MRETEAITNARREVEICNACRYCEGFCAVFPALELRREFSAGDLSYLANLCHNCRGCLLRLPVRAAARMGHQHPAHDGRGARGKLRANTPGRRAPLGRSRRTGR